MKRFLTAAIVFPILFGTVARAQPDPTVDESKPASSNVPGQQYPRLDSQPFKSKRVRRADRPILHPSCRPPSQQP